jgi:hypothetical protein
LTGIGLLGLERQAANDAMDAAQQATKMMQDYEARIASLVGA